MKPQVTALGVFECVCAQDITYQKNIMHIMF